MNRMTVARIGRLLTHRYLTPATRLALGGIFIFAGAAKLGDLHGFVDLVYLFGILPDILARIYGTYLPAVEVAIGVLLVMGLFLRFSALVSILMTVSFTIAKIIALSQGLDLPCGCFGAPTPEELYGETSMLLVSQTLALDFIMLALAFQILFHRGEFLALGPWLSRLAGRSTESPP